MSSYTKNLKIEIIDGQYWKLTDEFEYYFLLDNIKHTVIIPKGYITDFASIPRIFWSLLSYKDIFNKAAVVHDYLCDTNGDNEKFTKEQVDKIYLNAQIALGIQKTKAKIFYKFASWFGTIDIHDWTLKGK